MANTSSNSFLFCYWRGGCIVRLQRSLRQWLRRRVGRLRRQLAQRAGRRHASAPSRGRDRARSPPGAPLASRADGRPGPSGPPPKGSSWERARWRFSPEILGGAPRTTALRELPGTTGLEPTNSRGNVSDGEHTYFFAFFKRFQTFSNFLGNFGLQQLPFGRL